MTTGRKKIKTKMYWLRQVSLITTGKEKKKPKMYWLSQVSLQSSLMLILYLFKSFVINVSRPSAQVSQLKAPLCSYHEETSCLLVVICTVSPTSSAKIVLTTSFLDFCQAFDLSPIMHTEKKN